jgi:hypothetical protein
MVTLAAPLSAATLAEAPSPAETTMPSMLEAKSLV